MQDLPFQFAVIDVNGVLAYSNLMAPSQRTNLSDRDHFRVHRDSGGKDVLFISTPLKGRVSDKWTIQFTRPILRGGHFAGVMLASVAPERFTQLHTALDLGPDGASSILRESGEVMARQPYLDELVGKVVTWPLSNASDPAQGYFHYRAQLDGIERIFGYFKMPEYGWTFFAAQSTAAALAHHAGYRSTLLQRAGGGSLLLIVLLSALFRALSTRLRVQTQLAEQDKLLAVRDKFLGAAFDVLPVGVTVSDPAGQIVYANLRSVEILGLSQDQHQARSVGGTEWKIIRADGSAMPSEEYASVRALRQNCAVEGVEMGIVRDDGVRWLLVNAVPSPDPRYGVVVGYVDVTETRNTRQELDRFTRDFSAFLEQTSDFIYFKDKESRFRFCSQSLARITGHARWQDMRDKHDLDVFPSDTAQIYYEEELPVFRDGVPLLDRIDPYYDENGEVRYVLTNKWPLFDEHGAVVGIFGVSRDITEMKRIQEALAQSHNDLLQAQSVAAEAHRAHALLAQAVEHSSASVVITDATGRIEYVNPAFERTTGYHVTEAIGQNPRILKSGMNSADTYSEMWGRLIEGKTWQGELHNRKKNGETYWESATISPVLDDAGKISHYIAIKEDITERKAREIELMDAKNTADSANLTKSQFLATMSHEIRTPMNGILGMAQLLLMPDVSPKDRQNYVQTIYNSGNALLTLLNEILDLSKLEAGRVELEATQLQPARVIQEVGALFTEAARRKNLSLLVVKRITESLSVWGDATRLRQILSNLVGNAIKFTSSGSVRLLVESCHPFGDSAAANPAVSWLRFAVLDTGIGLTAEQKVKLFQPFSQADASVTRRFGGTGLGLAISRNLVELMGGRIGVESTPGQGSIFWFEVPLSNLGAETTNDRVTAAIHEAVVSHVTAPLEVPRGRHVLLVEDVDTNRLIVQDYLQRRGYIVSTAADGRAALLQASRELPDLILMDCHMPEMDGFEATRCLRASEAGTGRRLPIIALTADVFAESRKLCFAAGMDDFLPKPVSFKQLDVTLARWLGMSVGPAVPEVVKSTEPVASPILPSAATAVPLPPELDVALDELDQLLLKKMMNARRVAQRIAELLPPQAAGDFNAITTAIGRMDYAAAHTQLGRFRASQHAPAVVMPAAVEATLAVLDSAAALDRMDGDMRLLKLAASTVPAQIESDRATIHSAIAADAGASLRSSAHRLKGVLASIGASEAAAACFALENAGRHNQSVDYVALAATLDAALARLQPVLNDFVKPSGADTP